NGACYKQTQVDCVEQVQAVPRNREIPLADVLIAPVHRLAGSADAALASIHLVHKTFAVAREHHYIVPEGEQRSAQTGLRQHGAKILDLRGLAGAVEAGEADQQRALPAASRHQSVSFTGLVRLR